MHGGLQATSQSHREATGAIVALHMQERHIEISSSAGPTSGFSAVMVKQLFGKAPIPGKQLFLMASIPQSQGYLAHKKQRHLRTLQKAYA